MQSPFYALAFLIASWLITQPSAADEAEVTLKPTTARLRMHYENLELPDDEKMGLMGGAFLYDVNGWFSLGPSVYGALSGQRGGFITLGLAADAHLPIGKRLELNGGLFVGAGGGRGGFELQGGGLMLRPHLGLNLNAGDWGNFEVGVSYVDFPDGAIHSHQLYVAYEYPFTSLMTRGWPDLNLFEKDERQLKLARQEFSVAFRHYHVPRGVLTDRGSPQHQTIKLLGAEWQRYLTDRLFLKLESEGAMGGQSSGYMQILLGGGYRLPISDTTAIKISASAGAAGGGGVDTGGGLLIDVSAGIQQDITNNLFVEVGGSYIDSPGNSFRASSVNARLGYRFGTPDIADKPLSTRSLAGFEQKKLRVRFVGQTYIKDAPGWRNHHANLNIDLLGFQIDYFATPKLYLSGQGIGAWRGMAGGYMTGLIGGGLHLPLGKLPFFVEAEGLFGAAGGGGVDVAGGFVWQANANLGYQMNDTISFVASYGYMSAPQGQFRARVVGLSLAYRFSLFTARE